MLSNVEAFDPLRHHRNEFASGTVSIDNYLKLSAKKLSKANAAAVFVIALPDGRIAGFYALSSIQINASDTSITKDNPLFGKFNAVPATLLSMLGVDINWQKRGLGKLLLADALRRSFAASQQVGSYCVILDVLNDGNQNALEKRLSFYERFGFRRCDTSSGIRMFLTMTDIKRNLDT